MDVGRELSVGVFGMNGVGRDRLCRAWTRFYTLDWPDCHIVYERQRQRVLFRLECCGSHVDEVIRRRISDWVFLNDCYLLCFDLTRPETLARTPLQRLEADPIQFQPPHVVDRIKRAKKYDEEEEIPMILVGLKADLKEQRQVSKEDAEDVARLYDIPYIEISADLPQDVDALFLALLAEARRKKIKRGKRIEVLIGSPAIVKKDAPIAMLNPEEERKKSEAAEATLAPLI